MSLNNFILIVINFNMVIIDLVFGTNYNFHSVSAQLQDMNHSVLFHVSEMS